jgi:hypothetical protein
MIYSARELDARARAKWISALESQGREDARRRIETGHRLVGSTVP